MPRYGMTAIHDCEGCEIKVEADITESGNAYACIKMQKHLADGYLFFDSLESIETFHRDLGSELSKFQPRESIRVTSEEQAAVVSKEAIEAINNLTGEL